MDDLKRYLVEEFIEDYGEGRLSRRDALRLAGLTAFIPAIDAAMQGSGKTFRKVVYPDVDHGFNSDTSSRFNADAAKAAWDETLAWYAEYLS